MYKKIFIISLVFILSIKKIYCQAPDSIALRIVDTNLKVIEDYFSKESNTSVTYIVRAIHFLTNLTGIPSESDGNYFGQMQPTRNDLIAWKRWFILYKDNLSWDNDKKVIVVYKQVKPTLISLDR